jgi:hypothetical protein
MKPLLQFFIVIAFPLILAHARPVSAPLPAGAHATMGTASSVEPVLAPAPATAAQSQARSLNGAAPVVPIPPELRPEGDPDIPIKGSPLLLLSLIGFGLLIGGMIPAMRHRKINGAHS